MEPVTSFRNRSSIAAASAALVLGTLVAGCGAEPPSDPMADQVTTQLQAELDAAATTNAATAQSVRPVKPSLKCVDRLSSTSYRAHFGYTNSSSSSIPIPVGFYNRFYPNPQGRGQPTTFLAGAHPDILLVTFSSNSLAAWILGSAVVAASRNSSLCPSGIGGATGSGGSGSGGRTGAGGGGGMGVGGRTGTGGAGQCPSSCDDRNPCTTDLCSAATGFLCSNVAARDGTVCDDGNLCTIADTCVAGVCSPGLPKACQALDQCHLAGVCAPATGVCSNPNKADGTACNDGKVCTIGDACQAGVCTPAQTLSPTHCAGTACDQCSFDTGNIDVCSLSPDGCANCVLSTDGCDLIADPTDRQLCEDAYGCFIDPVRNCVSQGSTLPCWCGTSGGTCDTDNSGPGKANGACLDYVTRAARLTPETYDAPTIEQRMIDPDYPLGRAVNLVTCRGTFCSSECGVH